MTVEEKIKILKKDYILIRPREGFLAHSWFDLKEVLDAKPKVTFGFMAILARSFALTLFVVFILGGSFLGLAQATHNVLPGEPLYSFKRFSEDVIVTISGAKIGKVGRRADEVVRLVEREKDSNLLEKAIRDYEKAVLEAQEEVEKKGERQGFRQILEKQEAKFKETIEKNPSSEGVLETAIEASKKGRGENGQVQGVQEEDQRGKGRGTEKEKERENPPGPNPGRR